jgi:thiamine-monophosphate kinase
MNNLPDEKEIIGIIASALGIAELDDVATVTAGRQRLVFKSDMLVSSTDVPAQMAPWQIARKSVVSCASDLAAKGARPVAAMISLGLPKRVTRAYVEGLAKGFQLASGEFGVKIVGGDTNEAAELVIDCSMIGISKKIPSRSGARPGDAVVVSGWFGYPSAGLALLLNGALSAGQFRRRAIGSVLEPRPKQKFGATLARFFSASIDSSDGLAASLYEIAAQSGVDIRVDYGSAAAPGVEEFAKKNNLDAKELVFYGGEEYEIVATIPRALVARASAAAKKAGMEFHVIGEVTKGTGRVRAGKSLLQNRGYAHFS